MPLNQHLHNSLTLKLDNNNCLILQYILRQIYLYIFGIFYQKYILHNYQHVLKDIGYLKDKIHFHIFHKFNNNSNHYLHILNNFKSNLIHILDQFPQILPYILDILNYLMQVYNFSNSQLVNIFLLLSIQNQHYILDISTLLKVLHYNSYINRYNYYFQLVNYLYDMVRPYKQRYLFSHKLLQILHHIFNNQKLLN